MDKYYLALPIRDEKKEITGYDIKYIVEKPLKPRGVDCEILRGVETKFPKAVFVDKVWQVVEDSARKQALEAKEQSKEQRKQDLIAAIQSIDSLTTVAQLKTLLKKVLQHMFD